MGNDRLSGKQVGSQASRRVTRRLAWIQPVCISINGVPALKGLTGSLFIHQCWNVNGDLGYINLLDQSDSLLVQQGLDKQSPL